MNSLGVFEIFFGPSWSMEERVNWADHLAHNGLGFYLYGPKADHNLRKAWREPWPEEYLTLIGILAGEFRMRGVRFGVAISPFGVDFPVSSSVKADLRAKISLLSRAGVDFFGLFFDDMKSGEFLADMQLQLLQEVLSISQKQIIFCPSYYSTDPILDKVFGARPTNYLQTLGKEIPSSVDILWTGPKVISPEITEEHLLEVAETLGRKPFVCDNLFANDGPKNCKFLKLKEFNRKPGVLAGSAGWGINPMNQSALSQVVLKSAQLVFDELAEPSEALEMALIQSCSSGLVDLIRRWREVFLHVGLDQMPPQKKDALAHEIRAFQGEPVGSDIWRWLRGDFVVGEECLTD